jgi:hypothetical protein
MLVNKRHADDSFKGKGEQYSVLRKALNTIMYFKASTLLLQSKLEFLNVVFFDRQSCLRLQARELSERGSSIKDPDAAWRRKWNRLLDHPIMDNCETVI